MSNLVCLRRSIRTFKLFVSLEVFLFVFIYYRQYSKPYSTNNHVKARNGQLGAFHKVRSARGEGGPSRCDSLTGGGGQEHVTSRLYIILSYILNMKFKVMFNFLL